MESGDVYEILAALKERAGFFEVYEVTRFIGYRQSQHGVQQEVEVEILDAGPDVVNPHLRYHLSARAEGKKASGNTGSTPREALAGVHWYKLDS